MCSNVMLHKNHNQPVDVNCCKQNTNKHAFTYLHTYMHSCCHNYALHCTKNYFLHCLSLILHGTGSPMRRQVMRQFIVVIPLNTAHTHIQTKLLPMRTESHK